MKSLTLPSFWQSYRNLNEPMRRKARKTYITWSKNPFYPSLYFKCINHAEDLWSMQIKCGYRALGIMDADTVTWFWIGSHDDYERFY